MNWNNQISQCHPEAQLCNVKSKTTQKHLNYPRCSYKAITFEFLRRGKQSWIPFLHSDRKTEKEVGTKCIDNKSFNADSFFPTKAKALS